MKLKKLLLLCCLLTVSVLGMAQENKVEMADSNGRIYVVVAVVVTILLGLILYVARLDRKITRLEKENK